MQCKQTFLQNDRFNKINCDSKNKYQSKLLTLTDLTQDFIFALNFLGHTQCHTSYGFLLAVEQWMLANFAWSPSKTELISVKGAK